MIDDSVVRIGVTTANVVFDRRHVVQMESLILSMSAHNKCALIYEQDMTMRMGAIVHIYDHA